MTTPRAAAARRRGYSLVEINIVLVALSFVVTGAIWSFYRYYDTQNQIATEQTLEQVRTRIVSYALSHRTPGVNATFYDTTGPVATVHIPAGRPILPCPDLDGDGYEDRNIGVVADVSISVATPAPRNPVVLLDRTPGRCVDVKGNLPWRTLGARPADHWGQLHTYFVDHNFSHAAFGFDQTTRASRIFKHAVLAVDSGVQRDYMYPVHTDPLGADEVEQGQYEMRPANDEYPSRQIAPDNGGVFTYVWHGGVLGDPDNEDIYHSLAGDILQRSGPRARQASDRRRLAGGSLLRDISVYEFRALHLGPDLAGIPAGLDSLDKPVMADGIAFAIVSHGPNGSGRIYEHRFGAEYSCYEFPSNLSGVNEDEPVNLRMSVPCEQRELYVSCPAEVAPFLTHSCATAHTPGLFIAQVDGESSTADEWPYVGNDDIIVWMLPGDIQRELREQELFPIELPPVADLSSLTATYHLEL